MAALDTYVVVALLPAMLYDLDLSVDRIEQATPIVTGFLAGYIVVMPLVGLAADVRGRGFAFFTAVGLFGIGSALTATAGYTGEPPYGVIGLPWLVGGRVLQGIGGGALVPVALAVAADLFPPGRRDAAIGGVSAVQEAGAVLGPLYGAAVAGAATAFGGWRVVFWANLVLAALCAAGFWAARQRQSDSPEARAPRPDWLGALLLGGGLALLVVALYPDRPAESAVGTSALPAGAVALVFLAGWAWRQRSALTPVIPAALLRSREFIGSSAANLLVGGGLMVALVDVPVMARGVFDLDQLGAALLLARFMVAVPFGAVAGGLLGPRAGRGLTAAGGLALAAAAYALMAGWDSHELTRRVGPFGEADLVLALAGFGFGIVIAPLAAAVIDLADAAHHALAASLVVLVRTFGMLLGLTALSAYGLHRFYQLFNSGPAVRLIPGAPDFLAQKHAYEVRVTDALTAEYHGIFLAAAALCIVAGLIALVSLSAWRMGGSTTRSR